VNEADSEPRVLKSERSERVRFLVGARETKILHLNGVFLFSAREEKSIYTKTRLSFLLSALKHRYYQCTSYIRADHRAGPKLRIYPQRFPS
jgi:hypothetical protein